jgi:hypothetical protein
MLKNATSAGFINADPDRIITFVDPPNQPDEDFDWGKAALAALKG